MACGVAATLRWMAELCADAGSRDRVGPPDGGTSAVKLITAVVRAGKLDDVTRAVVNAGARA